MRKLLLLTILSTIHTISAQLPISLVEPIQKNISLEEYDGSIYDNLRFMNASVIDEKSGTFNVKLRYNIYNDAIEYKKGEEIFKLVSSPTTHARINDDYYYHCEFKSQRGLNRTGYYILVELNERYRVYKKYDLIITEPGKKSSVLDAVELGKIRKKATYYLEERGIIMELPIDKKEMLAVFSDKADELKDYIKTEKIKLRKEEDLVRFIARYNALKSDGNIPARTLISNSRN